jgi:UDP-glucose 4-epimerase
MVLGRIGLTGASGMLGRHINYALSSVGADVIAVSRYSGNGAGGWDLTNWLSNEEFDKIFNNVSAVVHAGAYVNISDSIEEEAQIFDANVRACLNLGKWALMRNIPLIYISGAIVYANPKGLMHVESEATSWSGLGGQYGFSKLLAEDVLIRLRQQGLMLAVLRPTSIYGLGLASNKIVQRFMSLAVANDVIELVEPAQDSIDLVHAADVASAVLAVLRCKFWGTLNVASGAPISFINLALACIDVAGKGFLRIDGEAEPGYTPSITYSLDISLAKSKLNWSPSIDIHTGLTMLKNGQYLKIDQV